VVDDDDDVRDALAVLLETHGYDVIRARSGLDAIACMECDSPTLVISDIQMPDIDGFHLVEALRARPSSAHVPIIVMTGHHMAARRDRALDLGADDYLAKPCDPAELLARIRVQLRHAHWHDELERRVQIDPLTDLLNRRGVIAALGHQLERARRSGAPLSVLMLDIDGFKQLNDTHGHAAGDAVLRNIARALTAAVRAVDVVGRLGGDEFVVIVPDGDEAAASGLAKRIAVLEVPPVAIGAAEIEVRVSAGVATLRAGESIEELLDRADRAMYRRKRFAAGTRCMPDSR